MIRAKYPVDADIVKAVQTDRLYILAAGLLTMLAMLLSYAGRADGYLLNWALLLSGASTMPLLNPRSLSLSLSANLVKQLTQPSGLSQGPNQMRSGLTVTNVPGSTLSREANHTMLLHAGSLNCGCFY